MESTKIIDAAGIWWRTAAKIFGFQGSWPGVRKQGLRAVFTRKKGGMGDGSVLAALD
jgi:hypothetical protein